MSIEPRFLTITEVILIHDEEILAAGGLSGIRDLNALESAIGAPQASVAGEFTMNLFEMAATYLNSIAFNHPFLDGNKRTALAAAMLFLLINGFEPDELYEEKFADMTLDLILHKISKSDFTNSRF